jgi:hypothetical protein
MTAGQLISVPFGGGANGGTPGTAPHSGPVGSKPDTGSIAAREPRPGVSRLPRQRDRRQALLDLTATLTRCLNQDQDVSLMRGALEEGLRRLVPVSAIQLREMSHRWAGRIENANGVESIALEVPGRDQSTRGVLEAVFDPGCRLGDWDFQLLTGATHLAALVLDIERSRGQLARAGLLNGARLRRDTPAPLIGSTEVMKALRFDIERVAGTNFTVLLEGESDP